MRAHNGRKECSGTLPSRNGAFPGTEEDTDKRKTVSGLRAQGYSAYLSDGTVYVKGNTADTAYIGAVSDAVRGLGYCGSWGIRPGGTADRDAGEEAAETGLRDSGGGEEDGEDGED